MTSDEEMQRFLNASLGIQTKKKNQKSLEQDVTITVLGLDGVGKSSLLHRSLYNEFDNEYSPTVEDMYKGQIKYNGRKFNMTIHEMGGKRQFPVMRQLLIKKTDGFILVYSVNSRPSFEEVKRLYNIIAEVKGCRDVPIVLVGNKSDSQLRYINSSDVCPVIRHWGHKVQRIEASAKTNDSCQLMFDKLMRMIDERQSEHLQLETLQEMEQCPLHKLFSLLHIPPAIFSLEGINRIVTRRKRRRRRRRISSNSSNDCTMQLLYVSLTPLIPDVKDYANMNW